MNKLKIWQESASWEEGEARWEAGSRQAAALHPLKTLPRLPSMPGMTEETAQHLKWKSLKWLVTQDKGFKVLRNCLRHPLKYAWGYVRSILSRKSYRRDEDFFFYGVQNANQFKQLMEDPKSLLVLGFSYCHKPFECPSGRFTDECVHDAENPVCRQCFIGKAVHAAPVKRTVPLFIPTIHYIGDKIFQAVHQNPDKKVLFMITACEMTLEMFGDWGNMVGVKGIGVRLDGRICNTMKAFELSERGIKPGLTVVKDGTQQRMLDVIRHWRSLNS